ncbi:hypothetical protein EON80_14735 [bacterium]|nr:MAG: hypothetical protein EON80_14735 [bacterium]
MKISALLLLSSLGAFSLVAQAAPVGMIAQVKGQVTTTHDGKKAPARLLSRIEAGTTVNVGPGSSAIVVLFSDGSRVQLGAGAKATVSAASVSGGTKLAGLTGPSANAVKLLGEARVGAIMARPPATYQRLLPDSPAYFLNPTPRFEWLSEPGAVRYTFTLFDGSDNVVWGTSTDQTGLDYPAAVAPLVEKRPYLWKLTAFSQSGKPVKSRFGVVTVLSAEDAKTLDGLVADLKNQATAAGADDKSSLLLLVETYRSFGVVNSALELLDSEDLKSEPGVAEAKDDVLDSLSPYARVLAGRSIEATKPEALF